MKKNNLLAITIIFVFILLVSIFALGLKNDPGKLNLATKGDKIPTFKLPDLLSNGYINNESFLTNKKYYLVNFWATWCPECYKEHSFLMELSNIAPIYGINWKDDRLEAIKYIKNLGNPYKRIAVDSESVLAIGMGVYGAPETFLISFDGTIIYRYAGALNSTIWKNNFLPKIKSLENKIIKQ